MNRIKWFDAVRAFGLLLVLVYHLFYIRLPGGFIGVDIFFTFSGYLITALIMNDVCETGRFALLRFYKRRIKRIMIPLFLSIVFTLPLALLISPDFTVGISKQVASTLSFTSNWYNISIGSSYEAQFLPQLYMHTWSLSVLIQFYIAWGAICWLAATALKAIYKKQSGNIPASFRIVVIALAAAIAVCSYSFMLFLYSAERDLNAIYFNTFARLFPFFLGAVAAAIWGIQPERDEILRAHYFSRRKKLITAALIFIVIVSVTVIVLFSALHEFNDRFIFHFGFLFTSLLTVVLIYSTHGLHVLTPPEKKEPYALTVAAELSYDLYLVHWPLYIIISALIMDNMAASLTTLAVSLAISALMFYCVEKVINNVGSIGHKRIAVTVVSFLVISAVAAGGGVIARVPPITSIESSFAASYIAEDVNDIISLGNGIAAIVDSPLRYTDEDAPLQANLLSAPVQPSATPSSLEQQTPAPETSHAPESSISPEPATSPESSEPPSLSPSSESAPPTESTIPPPPSQSAQSPSPESPSAESSSTPTPPPSPEPSSSTAPGTLEGPEGTPAAIPDGITVIGDSVPLGARTTMINRFSNCYVNAEVNRTISQGRSLLVELQAKNELREYVVIALGTNGDNNYASQFTRIIDALNPGHKLIIVTPFDGRANNNGRLTNETAEWIRGLPSQYDFITVADWNAVISDQVNLIASDKVHMGGTPSMELYTDVISEALGIASQKLPKS